MGAQRGKVGGSSSSSAGAKGGEWWKEVLRGAGDSRESKNNSAVPSPSSVKLGWWKEALGDVGGVFPPIQPIQQNRARETCETQQKEAPAASEATTSMQA